LVGLWALAAGPTQAEPAIHLVQREQLTLEIRALSSRILDAEDGSVTLVVGESAAEEIDLRLPWPDPQAPSRLRLRARRTLTPSGPMLRLESELARPGEEASVRAAREIVFTSEEVTALFEVARLGDRVLTLAIAGELTRVTDYSPRPVVGAPVQFQIDIEWVERGSAQILETNQLNTFVGQSVGYAFQLGEAGLAESLSIRLLPLQIVGNTVRLEVDVSGTLPDPGGGVVVISRKEQWLSTRETTTALDLASGEPPTGFRFLVTSRF
jgi:hypothetical protein